MVKPSPTPVAPQTTRWTRIDALYGKDKEAAWAWFIERYRAYVRGALAVQLRGLDRMQRAEEEFWGYVYLSDAIPRADRARRFRTYLAGILRNFARTFDRRDLAQSGKPLAADLEPPADAAVLAADMAVWTDTIVQLALKDLGAESPRVALAIQRFYGLAAPGEAAPPVQISALCAELQCTPGAVYQLLSRGRQRLRQLIEAELLQGCTDDRDLHDELELLLHNLGQRHPGVVEG